MFILVHFYVGMLRMRTVHELFIRIKKTNAKEERIFDYLHPLVARVHDLRSLFLTLYRLDSEFLEIGAKKQ